VTLAFRHAPLGGRGTGGRRGGPGANDSPAAEGFCSLKARNNRRSRWRLPGTGGRSPGGRSAVTDHGRLLQGVTSVLASSLTSQWSSMRYTTVNRHP
jgi:hypothetical protein